MEILADQNESDCDVASAEDENVALAHKIFSYRPTSNSGLIPKGGLKYSEFNGTEEESLRLQDYYKARRAAMSSFKVRKLANLGLAEWIPELNVAKIIEQGKFMQTFGFSHELGFHALYPEEALFLLDVGDIELKYKEALLSLQDAIMILATVQPGGSLCTLDEYSVYSHLCRMGYRVQRYFGPECDDELLPSSDEKMPSKRGSNRSSLNSDCKRPKMNFDEEMESSSLNDSPEISKSVEITNDINRGWWTSEDTEIVSTDSTSCLNSFKRLCIPNLGGQDSSTMVLPEIEQFLLPKNTCSWHYEVEEIWHQRLKKDSRSETQVNTYSFPKHINYSQINSQAKNWSHFKDLLQQAMGERKATLFSLCDQMHSGDLKPLVHPSNCKNIKLIHEQLQIFQEPLKSRTDVKHNENYFIRFNVFKADTEKPFRKTRPGKPMIRVCVVTPSNEIPDYATITELNAGSDGVPVKIALVDSGRNFFLGFDDIDIPIDLLDNS